MDNRKVYTPMYSYYDIPVHDPILVRYDASGACLWARHWDPVEPGGGPTFDRLVPDASGGLVAAGTVHGTWQVEEGGPAISPPDSYGWGFVAHFTAAGVCDWGHLMGQSSGEVVGGDSLYLRGYTKEPLDFGVGTGGPVTLPLLGGAAGYLLRRQDDGTPVWVRAVHDGGFAQLAVAPGGGVFFLTGGSLDGVTVAKLEVGDGTTMDLAPATAEVRHLFVGRYDAAGVLAWVRELQVPVAEAGLRELVSLPDGGLLLRGSTSAGVWEPGTPAEREIQDAPRRWSEGFLARLAPDGTLSWTSFDYGHVAVGPDGGVLAVTTLQDPTVPDAFPEGMLLSRRAPDGTLLWERELGWVQGAESAIEAMQAAFADDGSILLVGRGQGLFGLDPLEAGWSTATLAGYGTLDSGFPFLARLNADGRP